MFDCHDLSPNFTIRVQGDAESLDDSIGPKVEALWLEQSQDGDACLVNRRIFSLVDWSPSVLNGHFTEYKRYVAQSLHPMLYEFLRIRPLAVTGCLNCKDGIVFGLRGPDVWQYPNTWELVPSGSIDCTAQVTKELINPVFQILKELSEEVGISIPTESVTTNCFLIEDQRSRVVDLVFSLNSDLSAEQVCDAHAAKASDEYVRLEIVPVNSLPAVIAGNRLTIADASVVILQRLHLLEKI